MTQQIVYILIYEIYNIKLQKMLYSDMYIFYEKFQTFLKLITWNDLCCTMKLLFFINFKTTRELRTLIFFFINSQKQSDPILTMPH